MWHLSCQPRVLFVTCNDATHTVQTCISHRYNDLLYHGVEGVHSVYKRNATAEHVTEGCPVRSCIQPVQALRHVPRAQVDWVKAPKNELKVHAVKLRH